MTIDNLLLDKLADKAKCSPRLRQNHDLRNSEFDTSQRMLNALEMGTKVPIHRHTQSSETIILLRGKIDEIFFDENGKETERFHLDANEGKYGIQVPACQWHTLEVIEPAVIFEVKDGKFEPTKAEDVLG